MGEEGGGETVPSGRAYFLIREYCRCNEIQAVHIIVNYTRLRYIRETTLSYLTGAGTATAGPLSEGCQETERYIKSYIFAEYVPSSTTDIEITKISSSSIAMSKARCRLGLALSSVKCMEFCTTLVISVTRKEADSNTNLIETGAIPWRNSAQRQGKLLHVWRRIRRGAWHADERKLGVCIELLNEIDRVVEPPPRIELELDESTFALSSPVAVLFEHALGILRYAA